MPAEEKEEKTTKLVKVRFAQTPPSKFKLAYNKGEIGEVLPEVANELIEKEIATKA